MYEDSGIFAFSGIQRSDYPTREYVYRQLTKTHQIETKLELI